MQRVYSFSVKTEEDFQLVQKLKVAAAKKGKSFSWVVIQALKQQEAYETRRER